MKSAALLLPLLLGAQQEEKPDLPSTYSSKHYELKTSATKEQAEDLLAYMELVFDTYMKLLKPDDPASAEKSRSTILLYKNRPEFLASGAPKYAGAYYNLNTKNLVGYYDLVTMKPYFAHEGMHQFTDLTSKNYRDFPMWFSEGIADCIGNNEVRNNKLYLCLKGGTIARGRLPIIQEALKTGKAYKLATLLTLKPKPFMDNASLSYAQSWSFCHFLITYPDMEDRNQQVPSGKFRKNVALYYERIRLGGSSHEQAWDEAFKGIPLEGLEELWKKYVTKFEPARTLGFLGTELSAEQSGEIGLQDGRVGIRVTQVVPDGVGVKAGLAVGDVIISFDTKVFDDEPLNQLRSWMQAIPYGRRVKVVVRREGKDVDLWVTWEAPKKG
ncbi:MAG TPA: PDZ domain-containing protein [Planctomycetota bacterium]|nr:PDZ domain-containing protein [Planctomycetota bacterium]